MTYVVDYRGFRACPCLAAWLPVYEAELQRRGTLTGPLPIYQLIGTYAASGNTHRDGGAFDVSDLVSDTDVWVARQMGADATWARTRDQGFTPHLHGVLTGCPHNGPARYQIDDVHAGWNGLAGETSRAPDDGPRPLSGRTWREGIKWAKAQQEDEVKAEDIDQIVTQTVTALKPVIKAEVAANKLDVGGDKKLADDTVARAILRRLDAIDTALDKLNRKG